MGWFFGGIAGGMIGNTLFPSPEGLDADIVPDEKSEIIKNDFLDKVEKIPFEKHNYFQDQFNNYNRDNENNFCK